MTQISFNGRRNGGRGGLEAECLYLNLYHLHVVISTLGHYVDNIEVCACDGSKNAAVEEFWKKTLAKSKLKSQGVF